MANLLFGAIITGARGRIGGTVFTAGSAGAYARAFAKPSNPRTLKQSRDRLRLSLQPARWRSLTGTQRTAWATWAALPQQTKQNSLGVDYNPTGYQAFVMINVRLLRAGRSPLTDPPTDATPAAPVIDAFRFQETMGAPEVEIDYDPAQFSVDMDIMLEGWAGNGAQRAAQYRGYRIILDGPASPTGTYDFPTEWAAVLGTPVAEQQAIIKVYRQTSEGVRSAATQMTATYS